MLIGMLIIAADFAVIGGLIVAVVATALLLRPWRLAQLGLAAAWRWASLIVLSAALGVAVYGNVRFVTSSYNLGRPAPGQVTGTWADRQGATLRVLPDGRFTAAGLPADANDPAGNGRPHPADGHGTWQITRGDGTWYVLFTLSGGSQFRLDAAKFAAPGHASTAWFSYVFARYNAVDLWAFYRR